MLTFSVLNPFVDVFVPIKTVTTTLTSNGTSRYLILGPLTSKAVTDAYVRRS